MKIKSNSFNQMRTINASSNDIVIHNGRNSYSNLSARSDVTYQYILFKNAIDSVPDFHLLSVVKNSNTFDLPLEIRVFQLQC